MSAHEELCMCFKETWINFSTCVSGVYGPVEDMSGAASVGSDEQCTGSYLEK